MTLLSAVVAIFLGVAIATAAEVGAPIQARQGSSITLFTGRGFTGTSTTIGGDLCARVNEPFISNLLSARSSAMTVCFLYTGDSCTNTCAACVDLLGYRDMTAVPAVRSFRCVLGDGAACDNANCLFTK